jgi:hypothetical protein
MRVCGTALCIGMKSNCEEAPSDLLRLLCMHDLRARIQSRLCYGLLALQPRPRKDLLFLLESSATSKLIRPRWNVAQRLCRSETAPCDCAAQHSTLVHLNEVQRPGSPEWPCLLAAGRIRDRCTLFTAMAVSLLPWYRV